jgi:hypothetical protein
MLHLARIPVPERRSWSCRSCRAAVRGKSLPHEILRPGFWKIWGLRRQLISLSKGPRSSKWIVLM